MIPRKIHELVKTSHLGIAEREECAAAELAMARLDIAPESEFHEFCLTYCLSSLVSSHSYEPLVDICEPTESVALGTKFALETWELPPEFICITTCEGEGGYLYSKKSQAVYDFSLSERECFLANLEPRWQSFYEFLAWYLSPQVAHEL